MKISRIILSLGIDTETISYDLNHDGVAEFSRTLVRNARSFGRDTGWTLIDDTITDNQATYGYNTATGRLETVSNGTYTFTHSYLAGSNLLQTVTGPVHTVTNTFEANRDALLTKANTRNTDASDIASIGYTVNALGQRTNATRSGAATNSTAWAYDALGQLVQASDDITTSNRAYQYDSIGNREKTAVGLLDDLPTTPNYAANALNQYTTIPQATATPVYDFDGNMTSGPLPVSPTTNSTLVWDAENRLVAVKNGSTTVAAYSYDALSRRISKAVGAATTLYVYDGWNCIAGYTLQNSTFTLQHSYLWGMDLSGSMQGAGGVGGLLAVTDRVAAGNPVYYPCFDGNGNVTEYLKADGTVAPHFEYDPFGNTTVNTDSSNQFAYRFSTKPLDFETGLFYYGYRYYDPATGRWPSRDPIEEEGGVNVYAFTFNNLICEIDLIGNSVYLFQSESPQATEPAGLDEIRMKASAQEREMTKKLEDREKEHMIDECHFVWYDADGKSTDMGYGVEAATDFKQMMKDEKFVFVGGDFNSCADDLKKFKRVAVNNKLKSQASHRVAMRCQFP